MTKTKRFETGFLAAENKVKKTKVFLTLQMANFHEGHSIFGPLTVPQRAMSLSNSQMA